jgi:membrane protein
MKIIDLMQIFKDAAAGFQEHKVPTLSASLAYCTILTLGPMLLVIIFISNVFWGQQAINGTIYNHISGIIGVDAAIKIQELIQNATINSSSFMAIIGFIGLLIAATAGFTQIQNSMNTIWNLRVRKGRGWQQMLKKRLMSFLIIAGLGLLMLAFLILNSLVQGFMSRLQERFTQVAITLFFIMNHLVTLLLVAFLFAFIFKVLPDAYIKWKHVTAGAIFTAVLFMVGQFGVSYYINITNLGSAYGSAGSIIILLLWVYFSATILYLGAEITKAYALSYDKEIKPKRYAVAMLMTLAESNEPSVKENEKAGKRQIRN